MKNKKSKSSQNKKENQFSDWKDAVILQLRRKNEN